MKTDGKILEANRSYYRRNSEKIKKQKLEKYYSNKEKVSQERKEHYQKNKEKILTQRSNYYENNLEEVRNRNNTYGKTNRDKKNSYARVYSKRPVVLAKRRATAVKRYTTKIQATPSWLTAEQLEEIESIYLEAKRLEQLDGIKRHVDHIVPLKGKNVRGLHVPWNLQILTARENIIKSNKLEIQKED
jgi:hypothetical protein